MSRPNVLIFFFSIFFILAFTWYLSYFPNLTNQHRPIITHQNTPLARVKSACFNLFSRYSSSSLIGYDEELGGLKTYISGSLSSKRGILLVTDIYGYETHHIRKLADKVAEAGFYVVVPDFFHGDPWVDNYPKPYNVWKKDHPAEKGAKEATILIEALKDKGISTIGAAGFCWGGKVVAQLAKSDNLLKAVVLLHPALVTVDDIKEVKIPISILGGELDILTPPMLVKQFKEVLATKPEVPSFTKIFVGVAHGWTLEYNDNDEEAVRSAEEGHRYMLAWLTKYIKWDYHLSSVIIPQ